MYYQYQTYKIIQALEKKRKKGKRSGIFVGEGDTLTFGLSCRDHTDNIGSRKETMTNKVIREKPKFTLYDNKKSSFSKQKPNKKHNIKTSENNTNYNLFINEAL